MKFKLEGNPSNDTILILGISYQREGEQAPAKVFTYVGVKAGGLWYFTGTGRVPMAAGWRAVEAWLDRDGREVKWAKMVTETAQFWPTVHEPVSILPTRPEETANNLIELP